MGTSNYSDEFKRDAVHQITVRGYPVREVSRRLGVSTYSLYKWLKLFGEPTPKPGVDHESEKRRLKRELARVTEERDILKRLRRTSRARPNEARLHPGASRGVRRSGHVPGAAGAFLGLLCMAQGAAEPSRAGRSSPNRVDPAGLDRQRQGLWLSQADGRSARPGRAHLGEPCCPAGVTGRGRCAGRLSAPPRSLWRQARRGGREQAGAAV